MSRGKLHRPGDDQFIAPVNYQLFRHPAATNWWGELTLSDYVNLNEGDQFILETEDKSRGKCHLKKRVNRAVSGIPARYIYHVTGLTPLE